MDPELFDALITRIRAGIDALVDKLIEELEEVSGLLAKGEYDAAHHKVQAMITSVEESDSEEE